MASARTRARASDPDDDADGDGGAVERGSPGFDGAAPRRRRRRRRGRARLLVGTGSRWARRAAGSRARGGKACCSAPPNGDARRRGCRQSSRAAAARRAMPTSPDGGAARRAAPPRLQPLAPRARTAFATRNSSTPPAIAKSLYSSVRRAAFTRRSAIPSAPDENLPAAPLDPHSPRRVSASESPRMGLGPVASILCTSKTALSLALEGAKTPRARGCNTKNRGSRGDGTAVVPDARARRAAQRARMLRVATGKPTSFAEPRRRAAGRRRAADAARRAARRKAPRPSDGSRWEDAWRKARRSRDQQRLFPCGCCGRRRPTSRGAAGGRAPRSRCSRRCSGAFRAAPRSSAILLGRERYAVFSPRLVRQASHTSVARRRRRKLLARSGRRRQRRSRPHCGTGRTQTTRRERP